MYKCKEAHTIPTLKNDNTLECFNDKTISLLPNINKTIEKVTYVRLYKYFNKYHCLYKRQFGFINANSPTHALVNTTGGIRKTLYKNEFLCRVFLDFLKILLK